MSLVPLAGVRRQRELEEAAAAASAAMGGGSRSGGSVSSRSGKAQRVNFGADDLLAALTWVVVQVTRRKGFHSRRRSYARGLPVGAVGEASCEACYSQPSVRSDLARFRADGALGFRSHVG